MCRETRDATNSDYQCGVPERCQSGCDKMYLKRILQASFNREKFSLHHINRSDFYLSRWQRGNSLLPTLLIRIVLFLVSLFIFLYSIVAARKHLKLYYIYLTHWGLTINVMMAAFGCIISLIEWCKSRQSRAAEMGTLGVRAFSKLLNGSSRESSGESGGAAEVAAGGLQGWLQGHQLHRELQGHLLEQQLEVNPDVSDQPPQYVSAAKYNGDERITDREKVYWVLCNSAGPLALFISAFYWTVLHGKEKPTNEEEQEQEKVFVSILTHALNSLVVLVEVMTSSRPVRAAHVTHPVSFGMCYIFFGAFYYLAGGYNIRGHPYVYKPVDWGAHPYKTLALVIATVFMVMAMHFVLVAIATIRDALARRCM